MTTDGSARRGVLATPHGSVDTPVFMPVGTNATVKMVTPDRLAETGTRIVLANTYHLTLRPGESVVQHLGGLHGFMGWQGPILTDSGGFQVLSLAKLRHVGDDGVEFQSHVDGSTIVLTPERAIQIQNALGADIIMCFDECVHYPVEHYHAKQAMERTIIWAERCRQAHGRADQALFGIVQGSVFPDLRADCSARLVAMDFPGYALGGFSVGEGAELMYETIESTVPHLPAGKPRYLMGVGTPQDILHAVERGVDMFDCVMPTRNARGACAFSMQGKVRLRNLQYRLSDEPIDATCDCYACRTFSRGYIRHLFNVKEALAGILTSIHNIRFYQRLMADIRSAIAEQRFHEFKTEFLTEYEGLV
ncbi:MAG TPA: tRNA guanosine(34) transglycosylase Tgt [Planctomycetota bacterium]|nr:tRNA guanosine(34) transglycosylase Tgt [Planctomycetota bacterium]